MKKLIPIIGFIFVLIFFFRPFFLQHQLPIPADTIIGLYNPYRDLYAKDFLRGIPFKNFLITDPVRQQYPWKYLSVNLEKLGQLPLWNPYNFAGTPLLANHQSSPFYPGNLLFFVLPFPVAWGILIFIQPLLAGIFLYLYLRNLKLSSLASLLGSLAFAFCGFSTAWLEWGTILQTLLWLPLVLLSIDKLSDLFMGNKLNRQKIFIWSVVLEIGLISSFFAGILQIFFYVALVAFVYAVFRLFFLGTSRVKLTLFYSLILAAFFAITSVQLIPIFQFIALSGRGTDRADWLQPGWFVPWQNLVQLIAPDFFGNPTTLNYWGVWNYGELVSYVGIVPLILSLYALFRKEKTVLFYSLLALVALVFALPNPIAYLPFAWHIPFLNTAQPTRLLGIVDFALAVLSAFGLDLLLKKQKQIIAPILFIGILFSLLWIFVGIGKFHTGISLENILVAKHNLVLPTTTFLVAMVVFVAFIFLSKKKKILQLLAVVLIIICIVDLLRFSDKFNPFTPQKYLYPSTKVTQFLKSRLGNFRIMATDSRILPPNFSIMYGIQSVDGYDPLYLQRYGEFIAASERGRPDISGPFGFNRIITPQNINSPLINLLGVKYVLSLGDLNNPQFVQVTQEGETRVYENKSVLPRAFFVTKIVNSYSNQQEINALFDPEFNISQQAVVESKDAMHDFNQGIAEITFYSPDKVVINTQNKGQGFLVLTDSYYPTWHVTVDGVEKKIILTDFNFRGVVTLRGNHTIVFYDSLF